MSMDLPYLFTAVAYYAIGLTLLTTFAVVMKSHPVNRVFIFGAYLTPEGMRAVIHHWPLVSLFGLFIFACGVEHHLHWFYTNGHPYLATVVLFMGWIEAGISVITAGAVIIVAARWGVRRCQRKG